MSDKESDKRFKQPGRAYKNSLREPVYRLSELMFGSLLAAYVLGFITFCASNVEPTDLSIGNIDLWQYLLISTSYVCLTATMYLSYHTNILTNPTFRFKRIVYDFGISGTQGIFFGWSMLMPSKYVLLLALIIIFAMVRQKIEHDQLVESLYSNFFEKNLDTQIDGTTSNAGDIQSGVEEKKKELKKKSLKTFFAIVKNELEHRPWLNDTWLPYSIQMFVLAAALFLGGVFFIYFDSRPWMTDFTKKTVIIIIAALSALLSLITANKKSLHLHNLKDMDQEFNTFLLEMKKYSFSISDKRWKKKSA